jgi:ABC-type antimicrobial peptide transport system permease subunit
MSRLILTLLRLFVAVLLVVGLIALWEQVRSSDLLSRFRRGDTTTQRIVLKEVTALGKLELVKYTFKDIVEHEQVNTFLPNGNAILIVEGEATGCIDLTKIKADDIILENDSLTIRLPAPELCSWRINHDHSRVYDTRFTFLEESKLVDKAYQQAEKQIRQSALNGGILEQTRQNANRILLPLLNQLSGKKVGLIFTK